MSKEVTVIRERESVTEREILDRFGEKVSVLYTSCGHRVPMLTRELLKTQVGLRQLQSMYLGMIAEVLESAAKCPECS